MAGTLIVRPLENLLTLATMTSMTTEDPTYTRTRLNNLNPADPAKSTTGATTIVMTLPAPAVPDFFGIGGVHNLQGCTVTLTNGGGYSAPIVIPPRRADFHSAAPWLDMRAAPPASHATWTLAITGGALDLVIGELVLGYLTALPVLYGMTWKEDRPVKTWKTNGGTKVRYDKLRIERGLSGQVGATTDRTALTQLWQQAKGSVTPFAVIPDEDVQEWWLGQFAEEPHTWTPEAPNIEMAPVVIEEATMGIAAP